MTSVLIYLCVYVFILVCMCVDIYVCVYVCVYVAHTSPDATQWRRQGRNHVPAMSLGSYKGTTVSHTYIHHIIHITQHTNTQTKHTYIHIYPQTNTYKRLMKTPTRKQIARTDQHRQNTHTHTCTHTYTHPPIHGERERVQNLSQSRVRLHGKELLMCQPCTIALQIQMVCTSTRIYSTSTRFICTDRSLSIYF